MPSGQRLALANFDLFLQPLPQALPRMAQQRPVRVWLKIYSVVWFDKERSRKTRAQSLNAPIDDPIKCLMNCLLIPSSNMDVVLVAILFGPNWPSQWFNSNSNTTIDWDGGRRSNLDYLMTVVVKPDREILPDKDMRLIAVKDAPKDSSSLMSIENKE